MADWNPALYLQFEAERNKPIRDLLAHVDCHAPGRVIDIGCGPGNSTRFLAARWPAAELVGLDRSKAMLEAARKALPGARWLEGDAAGELSELGAFDVVFSNSVLQWLGDHDRVISRWFGLLKPGGALAVQLPHNTASPLHLALMALVQSDAWHGKFSEFRQVSHLSPGYYYEVLSALPCVFELWTTIHHHVLGSHADMIEWYRSTGFKPYLDQLGAAEQRLFLDEMRTEIRRLYPPQADGKILFDFERLFFVAVKR